MDKKKKLIIAGSVAVLLLVIAGIFYYIMATKSSMEDKVASVAYKIAGFEDKADFKKSFKYDIGVNAKLQPVMSNIVFPIKIRKDRDPFLTTINEITLKKSSIMDFDVDVKGVSVDKTTISSALYPKEYKTIEIIINANSKQSTALMDVHLYSDCSDGVCRAKMDSSIPNIWESKISLKTLKAYKLMDKLSSDDLLDAFVGVSRTEMIDTNFKLLDYLRSGKSKDTKHFLENFKDNVYATAVIGLYDAFFVKGDTQFSIKVEDKGLKKSIIKGFRASQNLPNRFVKVLNKIEDGSMSFEIKSRHSLENSSVGFSIMTPFLQLESTLEAETKGHIEVANLITSETLSKSARFASVLSKIKDLELSINIADDNALENVNKGFLRGLMGKYITNKISNDSATIQLVLNREFKQTPNILTMKARMKKGDIETHFSLKSPLANVVLRKRLGFNNRKLNNRNTPYESLDFKSAKIDIQAKGIKDLLSSLVFSNEKDMAKIRERMNQNLLHKLKTTEADWSGTEYNSPKVSDDLVNAVLASSRMETVEDLFDKIEDFLLNPDILSVDINLESPMGVSYIVDADIESLSEIVAELTSEELKITIEDKK